MKYNFLIEGCYSGASKQIHKHSTHTVHSDLPPLYVGESTIAFSHLIL